MSPQSKPAIQAASRQIDGPLLEVTDLSTHFRPAHGRRAIGLDHGDRKSVV